MITVHVEVTGGLHNILLCAQHWNNSLISILKMITGMKILFIL